jgi:hypothetical protein
MTNWGFYCEGWPLRTSGLLPPFPPFPLFELRHDVPNMRHSQREGRAEGDDKNEEIQSGGEAYGWGVGEGVGIDARRWRGDSTEERPEFEDYRSGRREGADARTGGAIGAYFPDAGYGDHEPKYDGGLDGSSAARAVRAWVYGEDYVSEGGVKKAHPLQKAQRVGHPPRRFEESANSSA